MLHIVNGDAFAAKLKESGIEGTILVWRESLYEGPLSENFTDPEVRSERLAYFVSRGIPARLFQLYTEEQEAALKMYGQFDQVVLWFEYDLYDQIMLIYLLQWFAHHPVTETTRLSLLCIDSFPGIPSFKGLGQLTPEQVVTLHGKWEQVSTEQLQLALKAWKAYTSANPMAVVEFLQREDLSFLPFLHRSLQCHLQRFPSVFNGLGQVEQLTLEAIGSGIHNIASLFGYVSGFVSDYGMGDSQYWFYLRSLQRGPHPLIVIDGPDLPDYGYHGGIDFKQWHVELTDAGRQTMKGMADFIMLNGIDRWLGGCHLQGKSGIWRRDGVNLKLID